MRVIFLFLLLLPATIARAAPVPSAEAEARTYLTPCPKADAAALDECLANQYRFVENYVLAKSGDASAAGTIAGDFSPHPGNATKPPSRLGFPLNPVQSCAWLMFRFVLSRDPNDEDVAVSACNRLSEGAHAAAFIRAGHLARELSADPGDAPGDDWQPANLPWDQRLPERPTDTRCLTSTVAPLTATPDTTTPPPPKGCPGNP